MKIYFNGWFSGFEDKTNPGLHVEFFLNLFEKVYGEKCEIGSIENSIILCEFDMLINSQSLIKAKEWKHSYLFSGESTLKCNKDDYTCVLWGERNNKNVVNIPLFIAYIYTNNFVKSLETKKEITTIPKQDVCVIISNPRGIERTTFLNELEKHFRVCYAGNYKNNIGRTLVPQYNTQDYFNFVNQFKFIVSMENSREDTYITEKLINGLLSNIIPVYWGCENVHHYINKDRFLNLNNINNTGEIIKKMLALKENSQEWLNMVNANVFPNNENKLERTLENIANDIKCVLNKKCWNHISQICCVSNPKFEPERCNMLKELFKRQNVDECFIKYISPTYKHTITKEIYNNNIKEQQVLRLRNTPMKLGELSLFLNYKANLEYIAKNYKDGIFLVFESDILLGKDINNLNEFLTSIKTKDWDLIHIGMYDKGIWLGPEHFWFPTGYVNRVYVKNICIEDITSVNDKFRLSRKFNTRCCDSFLWKYNSIIKYLNWMNNSELNFGVPMDYYMCNFFEKNPDFKHYWSNDEFFKQGSNIGIMPTTLQSDKI
jgi:hypothetical protein